MVTGIFPDVFFAARFIAPSASLQGGSRGQTRARSGTAEASAGYFFREDLRAADRLVACRLRGDPAKASPGQYIAERAEPAAASLPSRLRRVVVTCAYLLLMAVIYLFTVGRIVAPGAISHVCFESDFCSGGERILSLIIRVGLLGLCAVCITLGWRGRLVGARGTLAGDSG